VLSAHGLLASGAECSVVGPHMLEARPAAQVHHLPQLTCNKCMTGCTWQACDVRCLHAPYQVAEAKLLLQQALPNLKTLTLFSSLHAAVLQPGRLTRWLEDAVKMGVTDECIDVLDHVPLLLEHHRPHQGGFTPAEAPGLVPADQWKEGAVQLQREVGVCDCDCDCDCDCRCGWNCGCDCNGDGATASDMLGNSSGLCGRLCPE
jgi:hypothetical protein